MNFFFNVIFFFNIYYFKYLLYTGLALEAPCKQLILFIYLFNVLILSSIFYFALGIFAFNFKISRYYNLIVDTFAIFYNTKRFVIVFFYRTCLDRRCLGLLFCYYNYNWRIFFGQYLQSYVFFFSFLLCDIFSTSSINNKENSRILLMYILILSNCLKGLNSSLKIVTLVSRDLSQ